MTQDTKLSSCEGKIGFDGFGSAARANRHGGNNRPYRCSFCGKWHLGTWSRKKRAKGTDTQRPLARL